MMKHFNGIDVSQYCTHISVSMKSYLDTVFTNYGWDLTPTSLPMNPSNKCVHALDDATPFDSIERTRADNTHFCYRAATGELIWRMITTRPEIWYPDIKLSQFSPNPAKVHYDALYGIFQYLFGTLNNGITYTRKFPTDWAPIITHEPLQPHPLDRKEEHIPTENITTLYEYGDSEWAMDIGHWMINYSHSHSRNPPPLRVRTDARTNPTAQRATQLRSVLARVHAVSIQNQITTTVP
jgi:hypothetical protein